MAKYLVNGKPFENGREACQYAWDIGYLPNTPTRPRLDDKFNPLMLLNSAVAAGCEVVYKGNHLNSKIQPKPKPTQTQTQTMSTSTPTTAAELMQQAIQQLVSSTATPLDEARVIELIKENLPKPLVTTLEIKLPTGTKVMTSARHKLFDDLVTFAASRVPVMLVGEASSGKSTAAQKVSELLELPYYESQCSLTSTKQDFMGFVNVNGVVRTPFREAYENGGVFMLDEVNNASANVGVSLNNAIASGGAQFPDQYVYKHKDFVIIAADNTYGNGATMEAAGRQRQDKAFLDRFSVITWNIDEDFEMNLATNKSWCEMVQKFRAEAKSLGLRLISTRATFSGQALLDAGMPIDKVIDYAIMKEFDETTRVNLKNRVL